MSNSTDARRREVLRAIVADYIASQEEAAKKYNEAQSLLFEDLPAIPLWYPNATGGFSEAVSNASFNWKGVPVYYEITKN